MRSLPLNLAAFLTAGVLVIAISLAMFQAGIFDDDGNSAAVLEASQTPAVLDASASPEPTP